MAIDQNHRPAGRVHVDRERWRSLNPLERRSLGDVKIPRNVKADGKPLPAGTYQVRLTAQMPSPQAAGITMERWVEFVQGGQVKGREVVSIIPAAEMKDLNNPATKDAKPTAPLVQMLRGDEYLRVWINNGGRQRI